MLSALVVRTPSARESVRGGCSLALGAGWEITASLDPSDCLPDGSGSDTGSTGFHHSTAGGRQGGPLLASLTLPSTPHTSPSPVTFTRLFIPPSVLGNLV